MMHTRWTAVLAVVCALVFSPKAQAQRPLYQEYSELIKKAQSVQSVGTDLFGDLTRYS